MPAPPTPMPARRCRPCPDRLCGDTRRAVKLCLPLSTQQNAWLAADMKNRERAWQGKVGSRCGGMGVGGGMQRAGCPTRRAGEKARGCRRVAEWLGTLLGCLGHAQMRATSNKLMYRAEQCLSLHGRFSPPLPHLPGDATRARIGFADTRGVPSSCACH